MEQLKFDHENKLKELSKDSDSKGREVEALTRKIRQMEDEKKQQEKESQKDLRKLRDEIKKLEEEKSSLSKDATEQIERGRREVQHLKNRLAEKEKESTHQDEMIRSLHSTVSDQESAIKWLTNQNADQEKYIEEKRGQIEKLQFQLSVSKENWDKDGKELLIQTKNELKEILSENYTKEKNEEFQFILNQISRNKSEISDQMAGTKSVILKKLYDLQTSRNYDSQDTNNPTIVNIHGNVESLGSIGGQNNRNKNESIKDQTKAKLEDSSTKGSVREDGESFNSNRDIQAGRDVYSNLQLNSLLISSSVIVIAVLLYINRK